MNCHHCCRFIGQIDFSVGPHHCPCGFTQTDADGGGHHLDPSGGLWRWGDMAKAFADKLHIPQCGGCGRRQVALNDLGAAVRAFASKN